MPLKQSDAIILRTYNVGEIDKIAVFFSRDKGIIKGIAKGARKFGNRFGSSLEPLSEVKIFYYEKEKKDLVTVNNCDLLESSFDAHKDLQTSFTLSYLTELIEEFSPLREKNDVLYRLLQALLQSIKSGGNLVFNSRYFEAWLLKIHGVLPDFNRCKKCHSPIAEKAWLSSKKDGILCDRCCSQKKEQIQPVLGNFIRWTMKNPPPQKGSLPFSLEELETIKKTLQGLLVFHLERTPKTLRYI